jgi:hypothetical protein
LLVAGVINDRETVTLPDLTDILGLRINQSAYMFYCEHFLPWVTGWHEFMSRAHFLPVSHLSTTSDEAFGLLVLEKYWEEWTHEEEEEERMKVKKRGKGWPTQSLKRDNDLCLQIEADKKKEESANPFEAAFRRKMLSNRKEKTRKQCNMEEHDTLQAPFTVFNGNISHKVDLAKLDNYDEV